jgi:hypothetical protein
MELCVFDALLMREKWHVCVLPLPSMTPVVCLLSSDDSMKANTESLARTHERS